MSTDKLQQFQAFSTPDQNVIELGSNAVIYTRVSGADQVDGASLDRQMKECLQHAEKHSLNVVGHFGGTYESAKSDERKEFQRMLDFAKRTKKVSYIIVHSYDRFSRTGANAIYLSAQLKKQGILIRSATQETDPTTVSGDLQKNIYLIFSEFDNQLRREKCVGGVRERLMQGYWCTYPPVGYTNLNKGAKADKAQIVVNEDGKLIRKAFHWKAKQGLRNVDILKRLKKAGLHLTEKKLSKIFRNPFYCGVIVNKLLPHPVQGKHEAMVSRDLFLKLNGILESKSNMKNGLYPERIAQLPLRGFMKCDCCGTAMSGYLVKSKQKYYYKCGKKGCLNNRGRDQLHDHFTSLLQSYTIAPHVHPDHVRKMLVYVFQQLNASLVEEHQQYKENLRGIEAKIEQMEMRFAMGELPKDLFDKYHTQLVVERTQITASLDNEAFDTSNFEKAIDYVVSIAGNLSNHWVSSDTAEKLRLQELVFPDGIGYNRENDALLTFRVNSLFAPIPLIAKDLGQNKNGIKQGNSALSRWVETMGVEPTTS